MTRLCSNISAHCLKDITHLKRFKKNYVKKDFSAHLVNNIKLTKLVFNDQ